MKKLFPLKCFLPFPYFLEKYLNLNVVQIQTTAIFSIEYPNFSYVNQFFFENEDIYNSHKRTNGKVLSNINFLDDFKHGGIQRKKEVSKIISLTYFTQPIHLTEESELITFLSLFCQKTSLELKIKPHPRSDLNDLLKIPNVELIEKTQNSVESIITSDIVITRNSSIGLDCWRLNVPVIFFVNGLLKGD